MMLRTTVVALMLTLGSACTSAEAPVPETTNPPAPTAAPVAAQQDACSLLTPGQIAEATSLRVGAGAGHSSLFFMVDPQGIEASACDFDLADGTGSVRVRTGTERADEIYRYAEAASERIGPEMAWQQPGLTLWMLSGGKVISIELPFPPGPAPMDKARALAESIRGTA